MNTYDAHSYRITANTPTPTNTLTFLKRFLYLKGFKGITALNYFGNHTFPLITTLSV